MLFLGMIHLLLNQKELNILVHASVAVQTELKTVFSN